MKYKEQLNDPRWIMKAKEVKCRDYEQCQKCGAVDRLEVHHIRYLKFTMLWDYPENYLITLCRDCHQEETNDLKSMDDKIESMLTAGMFAQDVIDKFNVKF